LGQRFWSKTSKTCHPKIYRRFIGRNARKQTISEGETVVLKLNEAKDALEGETPKEI
jgi:hypothetical protein